MDLWKVRTPEQVRTEINRRLGRRSTDSEWAFVQHRPFCYVQTAIEEARSADWDDYGEVESQIQMAVEAIEAHAESLRVERPAGAAPGSVWGSPEAEPVRGTPDPALAALARLAAREAAQRPEVEAFRRKTLRGTLMPLSAVAAWVEAPRNSYPPGTKAPGSPRWIDYPGGNGRRIRPRSPLASLAAVVDGLVPDLGWNEVGAVAFVLAGRSPMPTLGSVGVTLATDKRPFPELRNRIRLEVHPSLPARDVAALYERTRGRFFGPRSTGYRKAGEDSGRSWPVLAEHVERWNDGRTWREALVEWNRGPAKGRPKWAYHDDRVGWFISHARKAYRNLTGSDLDWKGARSTRSAGSAHKLHTKRIGSKRRGA